MKKILFVIGLLICTQSLFAQPATPNKEKFVVCMVIRDSVCYMSQCNDPKATECEMVEIPVDGSETMDPNKKGDRVSGPKNNDTLKFIKQLRDRIKVVLVKGKEPLIRITDRKTGSLLYTEKFILKNNSYIIEPKKTGRHVFTLDKQNYEDKARLKTITTELFSRSRIALQMPAG